MKVAIGADPLGFELKEKVKAHLLAEGYEMLDLGTLAADEPTRAWQYRFRQKSRNLESYSAARAWA